MKSEIQACVDDRYVVLHAHEIDRLREVVRRRGDVRVAAEMGVARATLSRALAALELMRGNALSIRLYLARVG